VDHISDATCPKDGTNLTYENFGAAFVGEYCHGCHASGAENRLGAPIGVVFDTPSDIRERADRIYGRSALGNTSMPPGPDDPSLDE